MTVIPSVSSTNKMEELLHALNIALLANAYLFNVANDYTHLAVCLTALFCLNTHRDSYQHYIQLNFANGLLTYCIGYFIAIKQVPSHGLYMFFIGILEMALSGVFHLMELERHRKADLTDFQPAERSDSEEEIDSDAESQSIASASEEEVEQSDEEGVEEESAQEEESNQEEEIAQDEAAQEEAAQEESNQEEQPPSKNTQPESEHLGQLSQETTEASKNEESQTEPPIC